MTFPIERRGSVPFALYHVRHREALSRGLDRILLKGKGRATEDTSPTPSCLRERVEASSQNERLASIGFPDHLSRKSSYHVQTRWDCPRHSATSSDHHSGETGCVAKAPRYRRCALKQEGHCRKIGCTQPRRIAATTIARRIAEEWVKNSAVRRIQNSLQDEPDAAKSTSRSWTDGILLAEIQGDPSFHEYDTLIIDEAHERSLNIDFILGILRMLLQEDPT